MRSVKDKLLNGYISTPDWTVHSRKLDIPFFISSVAVCLLNDVWKGRIDAWSVVLYEIRKG